MNFNGLRVCIVCSDGVFKGGGVSRSLHRLMGFLRVEKVEYYIFELVDRKPNVKQSERGLWWKESSRHLAVTSCIYEDMDAANVMIAGLLSQYIIENKCSLVHLFYLGSASGIASTVCQEQNIPYIASARGSDVERSRHYIPRIQNLKYVCENASVVTCVTKRIANILSNICNREYVHFYNSYSSDDVKLESKKVYTNKKYMILDGRDYYKKGLPVVFRAVKYLSNSTPPLFILGERPKGLISEEDKLITYTINTKKVEFKGEQTQDVVEKYIKNATAFIQSGPTEGCPNILIEAIRHGCPIIASFAGAASEIITDKKNGYLFYPWDTQTLANNIQYVSDNPNAAMKVADNAMKLLDNEFSPEQEKANWINVYKQAITIKKSKGS